MGRGRTVVDQVTECAVMNGIAALMVQRQAATSDLFQAWEHDYAALDTLDKALKALRENTESLAETMRGTPDAALDTLIEMSETQAAQ